MSPRILSVAGPTNASPIRGAPVEAPLSQEVKNAARIRITIVMKLRYTLNFQFTSAARPAALYNKLVTREFKRPLLLFGGFALLFAAFVALLLRILPGDRTPFDYMVAGTFA